MIYRRGGVGSIAICGSEKTVIFDHDGLSCPGKTYPIGASGAIISDVMDDIGRKYLCCYLAKDKRMVVFELLSKEVVVELHMTTKLNFWRFLSPVAHSNKLIFMLITPLGGFHWFPLEDSPRPQQIWKRPLELQGKRIVAYEEGGYNGMPGKDCRSTIALLLTSSTTASTSVEAWCIQMIGNSNALCISSDILGAALFSSFSNCTSRCSFEPNLVTASKDQVSGDLLVEMFSLYNDELSGNQLKKKRDAKVFINIKRTLDSLITEPTMVMGTLPPIFCLCCGYHVVIILRSIGILVTYIFIDGEFCFKDIKELGHYVVDAAIKRSQMNGKDVEVVTLLSDRDNPKDGQISTIKIKL